jgi:hypothetical protein
VVACSILQCTRSIVSTLLLHHLLFVLHVIYGFLWVWVDSNLYFYLLQCSGSVRKAARREQGSWRFNQPPSSAPAVLLSAATVLPTACPLPALASVLYLLLCPAHSSRCPLPASPYCPWHMIAFSPFLCCVMNVSATRTVRCPYDVCVFLLITITFTCSTCSTPTP